jgi:hypothetical protein
LKDIDCQIELAPEENQMHYLVAAVLDSRMLMIVIFLKLYNGALGKCLQMQPELLCIRKKGTDPGAFRGGNSRKSSLLLEPIPMENCQSYEVAVVVLELQLLPWTPPRALAKESSHPLASARTLAAALAAAAVLEVDWTVRGGVATHSLPSSEASSFAETESFAHSEVSCFHAKPHQDCYPGK